MQKGHGQESSLVSVSGRVKSMRRTGRHFLLGLDCSNGGCMVVVSAEKLEKKRLGAITIISIGDQIRVRGRALLFAKEIAVVRRGE